MKSLVIFTNSLLRCLILPIFLFGSLFSPMQTVHAASPYSSSHEHSVAIMADEAWGADGDNFHLLNDAAPVSLAEPTKAGTPSMLQFRAGGHVLGFAPNKVYLAGLDHALTVEFVGGQRHAPVGDTASTSKQADGAPVLRRVTYPGVWRGVDVLYTASQVGIAESSYIVQPGAYPADIRLKYNTPVQLMDNGTLLFAFETGYMTESAPVAFQNINGKRVAVAVHFTQNEDVMGFAIGAYDPHFALTIDPFYTWHTFYGSSNFDSGNAITSDGSGNIYVAGESTASWNGPGDCTTTGVSPCPLNAYAGSSSEIVVVKLNSAGAYQWHTFYGSASFDQPRAITSDGSGNIYVAGHSNASWNGPGVCMTPGVSPCPLNAYAGGADIVVVKLNGAGGYQWHTFYGSSGDDYSRAITSDVSGIYVTGVGTATWNGLGVVAPQNAYAGGADILVVKLDSAGAYQWHTFYGSSVTDYGWAITSNGSGIYLAGRSDASWNGPGAAAPLNAYVGGKEIVVVKLNSAGAYQWHAFYGSSGNDEGLAITSDGSGIYVTGYSRASWIGPGAAEPLNAHSGGTSELEIVVVKLNSAGAYQWHTFFGSADLDEGLAITTDGIGNIYVAGESDASWNGPGAAAPLNAYAGGADILVVKLNSAGAYQWHTFYGSADADEGYAITSGGIGNIYVAGNSYATWNGPGAVPPLNVHTIAGTNGNDIVVVKLAVEVVPPPLLRIYLPAVFR